MLKKDWKEYLNIKTVLLLLLVALLIFIPVWGNRRYMNIAILVLMYVGLGESWNLLSGMSGLFSIAHALFFGIGVYGMTIGMTKLGLSVVGGILLGLAANLVMALIAGFVGSKLSGLYFTMALIVLHGIIYNLAGQLPITGYSLGLSMPREYLMSRRTLYFLVLALAILMPSTAAKGKISKIVPLIDEGAAVTTNRYDVNYVVTEYGIAQLKGKTLRQRAQALIAIAHPAFRPMLAEEYEKRFREKLG